ncbi:hypothetical protein EG329_007388 [Mollisiaceae sp. DMI_Dod_QoI]|nr:hypothetical protein EG329_007388 [Helotiales sp. DMI_Dod_QoI]
MQHGPTAGDFPPRDVDHITAKMINYRNRTAKINPESHARIRLQAVVNEYIRCLETFKIAVQDVQCYPFLSRDQLSEYVLGDLERAKQSCSEGCITSIDAFKRKIYKACPSAFNGVDYSKKLQIVGKDVASFVENFFKPDGTISAVETVCRPAQSWSWPGLPCAAVFKQWGKQDWAFQTLEPVMKDLISTTRRLLEELPKMPKELKEWKHPGRNMTPEEAKIANDFSAWRTMMEQGVCSDCM